METTMTRGNWVVAVVCAVILSAAAIALGDFKKDVGDVKVGPVAPMTDSSLLKVPFITWGGDMATFHANGGLKTAPGSVFAREGLHLELMSGDDFAQQTRDYLSGRTPFLRGTFSQIGMATQVIGADDRTKGVAILQLTWSLGDHMVGRKEFKNLNDLKGKTICLQQGGPHVGFLDDILDIAKLTWDDIHVVWARDVTATKDRPDDNPAAMFRKDQRIDACFVISPDMVTLCGDRDKFGDSKVSGQVNGAHVVVSTADMTRSIADMYLCRRDFFDAHTEVVEKFVYGYLKACENVSELYKAHESPSGAKAQKDEYQKLLEMTQNIYGKAAIPTLDDAHGLLSDCDFANYDGNARFFTLGENNTNGFEALQRKSLDVALAQEYVTKRVPLAKVDFKARFNRTPFTTLRTYANPEKLTAEIAPGKGTSQEASLLFSFNIYFEINQEDFSPKVYGRNFKRAVEMANKFGTCAIHIRGHADPSKVLLDVIAAGEKLGTLRAMRNGDTVDYIYNGQPLDLKDTAKLMKLVDHGDFENTKNDKGEIISPRQTMTAAEGLARTRAELVKKAITEFARNRGVTFTEGQFGVTGAGISEPVVPLPKNEEEAQKNRRVEFRLVRVKAE
jgi:ABC-type nitrate/sulfonate/bicarbonate transport system substrate-binding protein